MKKTFKKVLAVAASAAMVISMAGCGGKAEAPAADNGNGGSNFDDMMNGGGNFEGFEDEKLPQTGLTEDITIMFFIVLCVASAVFAYVKIRKYNEK